MNAFLILYPALIFAGAAVLGLVGTNRQAAAAKRKLTEDPDRVLAEAGSVWTPSRLVARRATRRRRRELEAQIAHDPKKQRRYVEMIDELFAWNALESGVALALSASLVAAVAALIQVTTQS